MGTLLTVSRVIAVIGKSIVKCEVLLTKDCSKCVNTNEQFFLQADRIAFNDSVQWRVEWRQLKVPVNTTRVNNIP